LSRFAPLTGVIFIALAVGGGITGGSTPSSGTPGAQVISFYETNQTIEQVSDYLFAFAAVFFLFFAGALHGLLRRNERTAVLSVVGLGGAVVLAAGLAGLAGLAFSLAGNPGKLDPAAAQALNEIGGAFYIPLAVGAVGFSVASGIAIIRSGLMPRWLGWAAIVIAVVSVTPVGWVGLIALAVWVLVVSVLSYLRGARSARSPVAASAL
jgi:hypothetical protein